MKSKGRYRSWCLLKLLESQRNQSFIKICFATQRIILSGDIETNPEPVEVDNNQIESNYELLPSPTCEIYNKIVEIKSRLFYSLQKVDNVPKSK